MTHLITITVNAFSTRSFAVGDNEPLRRSDHIFVGGPVEFDRGHFLHCVPELIPAKDQYR